MPRFVLALLAALFFSSVVFAQAAPGGASPQPASPAAAGESAPSADPARPFPLVPILETILAGEISWRPDWPPEMPPDLFAVSGEPHSVTVTLEFPAAADQTGSAGAGSPDSANTANAPNQAVSSNSAGSPEPARFEYTLSRGGDGRFTDFPFFMDGGFFQTAVTYDELGRIAGLTVSAAALWRIEFMEHDEGSGLPVLARLNAGSPADADAGNAGGADSGGVWFFAALEYRGLSASETWYDPAGTGLAVYSYRYDGRDGKKRLSDSVDFLAGESRTGEYHYDSWGNLTGVGGAYSAVYREDRPQYWRRPLPLSPAAGDAAAGTAAAAVSGDAAVGGDAAAEGASSGEIPWRFIFQWDERRLVTGLLGYPEDESAGDGWDIRYDYAMDGVGNWTERREIRMIRRGGYLFPRAGVLVSRKIDYREQ
ncbi:MAG: hypothetical protein LBP80_11125 [Treponema sp.]|jgi:hypothetical protein|nr:hypothetical protein [Treponema sp.]